ncbi:MAG: SIS domain-containing protein [Propionibacteriaceae bacterium]|nr:SIS domain-containing protein [Propionibacteriaceae bacterium]
MFNIDPQHHFDTQRLAVAQSAAIRRTAATEVARGLDNVFFASAGGVALLTYPAARLLQQRSSLPVFIERAAELAATENANLGPRSLVVLCSVSGTTKEAVAMMKAAQARGAHVLTFTGTPETPLATLSDINIATPAADDTSSETYLIQTLVLALALMEARGELSGLDEILTDLALLPSALVAAKQEFEPRAQELAAALVGRDRPLMFTGAGGAWYEAWYFAMCILEEMQWIWTRPIHASDFFHGTFELVEKDVAVVLLTGEDASRPLAERVKAFVPGTGGDLFVIDTAEFELAGIGATTRALVSPIVLATVLERLSVHVEALTGHPLTTRRYYKRMEY